MPEGIEILYAETGDLTGILEVQRTVYMQEAERLGDFDITPLHQTLDSILEDYKHYQFFKAADGGRILETVQARLSDNCYCWLGGSPYYQSISAGNRTTTEMIGGRKISGGYEIHTFHRA